jgi:Uma2 family endonuclease
MSTAFSKRRFTVAEYLALEADSLEKHEFYQGEIFAMAGATIRHNEISGNIFAGLHARLRGTNCRPYGSDLRIRVKKPNLFTYSDTLVICGKIEHAEESQHSVTNPRVVFEVLSKSTENYDRGQKWEFYQQLDSLREYVIVSQEEAKVTRYLREEGGPWRYLLISGQDQILALESLDCELPLAEIYENVSFGPEEETASRS